jgi:DNA-binding winged helix-turn-helix (wHTH) protein/quercetin dioxygenase-like cupin family protein
MANGNVLAYRFGEFVLNVERGCLQRDGGDLELRPKAFELLLYLVRRAGKLASKDELVQAAWPNVTVSDDSLAQCVSDVRRLLDDEAQRFIKTVPRRGYVFVADVQVMDGERDPAAAGAREPAGIGRLLNAGRLHLPSFGLGLVVPLILLGAWVGATKAMTPSAGTPTPPYPLFQGNKTIMGQTIAYPGGTPLLKAAILFSKPGEEFDWHLHKIPTFGYVLGGEITIDYGSKGIRVLRAGDALLEALDWPHRASNRGTVPARVFVLYMGSEGTDFSTPVSGPK